MANAKNALLAAADAMEAPKHYQQAVATLADAQYQAASSQSRSALESFIKSVAAKKGKNGRLSESMAGGRSGGERGGRA